MNNYKFDLLLAFLGMLFFDKIIISLLCFSRFVDLFIISVLRHITENVIYLSIFSFFFIAMKQRIYIDKANSRHTEEFRIWCLLS